MTLFRDATYQQQIRQLIAKQEPEVRRAFLAAIEDIRDRVTLRRLRDAIAAGDIDAAIRALNLEVAAYGQFSAAISNTYAQAGAATIAGVSWRFPDMSRAVVRWDFDNPRARNYLLEWSSRKITGDLIPSQIQAVRGAIEAGYRLGRGPRDIALDIVGRMGANGKRTGGILGLNGPQQQWVSNMRGYLANDPARALSMRLSENDKAIIRRAMEKGLTAKQQDAILTRYERGLLKLRGDTIARTETAQSVNAARQEAMRQGLDATGVPDSAVVKVWKHAGDAKRERPDHAEMHNEEVIGLETPFILPDGTQCLYPLDPTLPAEHSINCRCSYFVRIDYASLAR